MAYVLLTLEKEKSDENDKSSKVKDGQGKCMEPEVKPWNAS